MFYQYSYFSYPSQRHFAGILGAHATDELIFNLMAEIEEDCFGKIGATECASLNKWHPRVAPALGISSQVIGLPRSWLRSELDFSNSFFCRLHRIFKCL